ncbi:MAG: RNA 2',3'-cyclic phosphodiesterase [Desulfobacterota bacterium]|jgi:2'-5' RNA ligase|nr:RNA 2',3'-cyclic phosphodiesterase [Thermodesulfobacteriota bacterium]
MIRSFLAVDLPREVKDRLAGDVALLRPGTAGIKWVNPDQAHLTLKFFGSIPEETVRQISAAVARTVPACRPFDLVLRGVGGFPNIRRPRVVWAGLGGDQEALKNLWIRLEEAFFEMGIPRETRPFNPHLTLGRNKTGAPNEKLFSRLANWQEPDSGPFTVREVVLFRSDLKPAGPVYTVINTFPLTGT